MTPQEMISSARDIADLCDRKDAEIARLRARLAKLETAARPAVGALQRWLDTDECDCPPEGHFCGRPQVVDIMEALRDALAQEEP